MTGKWWTEPTAKVANDQQREAVLFGDAWPKGRLVWFWGLHY